MSHYPAIVLVPADTPDPVEEATRLLAPYDENGEGRDGTWGGDGTRWDWWKVGGRWTGALDGHDPRTDPANIERCNLCNGTGSRPDGIERFGAAWAAGCNGCNGCNGLGWRLAWSFRSHPGDIRPVHTMQEFLPHAIVTPDGAWHEGERVGLFGSTRDGTDLGAVGEDAWPRRAAEILLAHRDHIAVLVDCHV